MLNIFKKFKTSFVFVVRLTKLLFRKQNNELCIITFDNVTGNYVVLTHFSCVEVLDVFYTVIKSMNQELLNHLNKSNNPEHWSNPDSPETKNILVDPGSKATN